MDSKPLRLNKYSILASIYFFFNSIFLPKGLLYTNILSPVFFYNLIKNKQKTYWNYLFLFLLPYDLIHFYHGVDAMYFVISNALFISTFVCVISFYHFVTTYRHLSKLFRQIVVFNALLTVIAIPFLFLPKQYQQWFWYVNELTKGFGNFPRLALFTYEASYYSLLLIPVWFYYLLKFVFNGFENNKWLTITLITVPMLLSLSFGVIGATCLTVLILFTIFWKRLFKYQRALSFLFVSLFVLVICAGILWFYFPLNPFFVRLENIFTGKDTSANGRTIESFTMAWRIADMRNVFFGAGLGQIKIVIIDLVHTYYRYWGNFQRYDIPNAMGETLAIFGITGLALRLFLEIYLFFKTKVFSNYYRLALFIFIFIYQFTGSFITNIVEYVIWVLAFSTIFNQFDINKKTR